MTDPQLPLRAVATPKEKGPRTKRPSRPKSTQGRQTRNERQLREQPPPYPNVQSFRDALDQSEPRPPDDSDSRTDKKNYAERLSNKLAILIADKLRTDSRALETIVPDREGRGRESTVASGTAKKLKKTDVRYSTHDTGLELLVSIKTYSFQDPRKSKGGETILGRYTKNMVRNDHELRAEAMDHHERHPYAVLVALFFLPIRSCDDGEKDKSSFAHAIMTFRARAGRVEPSDPREKFERFFVGLYELEGEKRGEIWFFDVMDRPPRQGRPRRVDPPSGEVRRGLLTLDEVVREIVKAYGIRNRRFIEWSDSDPNDADLLDSPVETETDDTDEENESA